MPFKKAFDLYHRSKSGGRGGIFMSEDNSLNKNSPEPENYPHYPHSQEDDYANEQFKLILGTSTEVCGLATEEEKESVSFESDMSKEGKYIVCMDPLDGSSNIDVNVSIGTIFSIYRRISESGSPSVEEDFLQAGTKQVAAGYVLYGPKVLNAQDYGVPQNRKRVFMVGLRADVNAAFDWPAQTHFSPKSEEVLENGRIQRVL